MTATVFKSLPDRPHCGCGDPWHIGHPRILIYLSTTKANSRLRDWWSMR